MRNPRKKPYVGIKFDGIRQVREPFLSADTPTFKSHGKKYAATVGPFRTRAAAQFMALYGGNGNPHLQHVDDAERIAKAGGKELRKLLKNARKIGAVIGL